MKLRFILVLLVLTATNTTWGALITDMEGDDDGFGTGSPVSPGDIMYGWTSSGWGPMDPDGFDGYSWGTAANPDFQWTHNYTPFLSITSASLYMQNLDFPESGGGELWIDGNMTSLKLPIVPLESGPHTVHGVTFDLTPYSSWLLDGSATFGINVQIDDGYSIDYAVLTIDGVPIPTPIPAPGAFLAGLVGIGCVNWLRRRRML